MTYSPGAIHHRTTFKSVQDDDLFLSLATPRPFSTFNEASAPRFIGIATGDEMDEVYIPAEIEASPQDAMRDIAAVAKNLERKGIPFLRVGSEDFHRFMEGERSKAEAFLDLVAMIKNEDDVMAYRRWYFGGLGMDPLFDALMYRQFTQVEGLTYKCLDQRHRDVVLTLDPAGQQATLAWHRSSAERFETHIYTQTGAYHITPQP